MTNSPHSTIVERIEDYLNTYMVFPEPEQATICALWTLHTWTFSQSFAAKPMTTPYLYINSEGPRSGKTLLIDLLEPICLNPERTVDMSGAVMFRLIEKVQPTLFLDEVDTINWRSSTDPRVSTLNGGYKHSGYTWRNVGGEPEKFRTFCPKLLSGIHNDDIPDATYSRCIDIRLRRVATLSDEGELIAPDGTRREIYYSFMAEEVAEQLIREIQAFMAEWTAKYHRYVPRPVPGINPRAWEIAFPLVQIAAAIEELTGAKGYEEYVRGIIAKVLAPRPEKDSPGVALLKGIKAAFENSGDDRLFTAELCEALGEGWNGKLLGARLREFKIGAPTTITKGNRTLKGYHKSLFKEAWENNL